MSQDPDQSSSCL
uniref:Uncharacterized protein n=1 Tax=Arundo donax TaxID=35708 RepID=A0A0A8ZTF0_ARUDO